MLQQQVGRGVVMLPEQEQQLRCPRCDSTDTKFCYYNNYNLSQPRHFCRSCRRYWTKGGALRNVPVGGGTRKGSKRSGDADAAASCASKRPNVETGRETVVVGEEGGAAVAVGGGEGVNTSVKASGMAEGGGEGGGWSMSMGLSSMFPSRTTGTSFE